MTRETCDCPHCGSPCDRDEVDVGVGVIHGPWGCAGCGWSSDPAYDSRDGVRRDGYDRVFDQWGGSHHVDRIGGKAVLAEVNVESRGCGHHVGCRTHNTGCDGDCDCGGSATDRTLTDG